MYAGRLAEESNISKTAIMTQLETAVKRVGSKRRYEKKKAALQSGEMNQIKVSYTAGGSQALGIVSAQQRLLAAILLFEIDQILVADMTATVFSPELQNSARRDGQEIQLKALQQYWQLALAPGMQRAVNQAEVAQDVADFVDRIDQLVTAFDHTTEQRIERVVWIHRILAIGMALLLIFTIIWLRARLLRPWKQLLSIARAVSQRDFTQRAHISGRNEMATLGMALNNMSEELAESYAVLERRVQEKTA